MRARVFGVPLDALTMDETVAACVTLAERGRYAHHVSLNAGKVVMLDDVQGLAECVEAADLVSADGQSVVWAARLLGVAVPERVAGIDLMDRLLAEAAIRAWPVFFLGAEEPVVRTMVDLARKRFDGLVVAGVRNGFFEDDARVAEEIRASGARLLLLGFPSPRKELFLAAQAESLGPLLAVGVGGSFDVWAGKTRRAPRWMQRWGLEWFYRFVQEPRRMWRRYLVGNARFVAQVAREARRGRKTREKGRP